MGLLSFVPLPHVVGLQIQGQLMHYFFLLYEDAGLTMFLNLNLTISILTLFAFYSTDLVHFKILLIALTLYFLMSFLYFQFEALIEFKSRAYYLNPLIYSTLITLLMFIIVVLLEWKNKKSRLSK